MSNSELKRLRDVLNEERATVRLQNQHIEALEKTIQSWKDKEKVWLEKEKSNEEKESEMEEKVQLFKSKMESVISYVTENKANEDSQKQISLAIERIQELEEEVLMLREENKNLVDNIEDLSKDLYEKNNTVENLNTLSIFQREQINMQQKQIEEYERLQENDESSSTATKPTKGSRSRTKKPLKNLVQRSIREYHPAITNNSQPRQRGLSYYIERSNSIARYTTNGTSHAFSSQGSSSMSSQQSSSAEVIRPRKRPLDVNETEHAIQRRASNYSPRHLTTMKNEDNNTTFLSSDMIQSPNIASSSLLTAKATRNNDRATLENKKENTVGVSDSYQPIVFSPMSEPVADFSFPRQEQQVSEGSQPSIIDISGTIPSLESATETITTPATSPSRQQSSAKKENDVASNTTKSSETKSTIKPENDYRSVNNIPRVKREQEEEVADFTSILCATPRLSLTPVRQPLGDATNSRKSSKNKPNAKGKQPVILKTTSNSDLLGDITNAATTPKVRHQHDTGQTCIACDKFYDTAQPLLDVENDYAVLNTRDRIQLHSKHRSKHNSNSRATTPPGFWDIDFTLSNPKK